MDIELDYTSGTSLAPSGFVAAMQYAADQLDALILDPVTISISVSWNDSVFGEGGPRVASFSYSSVVTALEAHAESPAAIEAAANLPTLDPTGSGSLLLSVAQAEALGLTAASPTPRLGGSVTFGTEGTTLDFSTTATTIPANEYDFVATAEHELTHALGRIGSSSGPPKFILDLYRYASPGVLQTNGTDTTYFSIDGGDTALAIFSTASDLSDWALPSADDPFDAYAKLGVVNTITSVDKIELSALGFDVLCFVAGTRIAVPGGAVAVELLAIGDEVMTLSGQARRVKWIGVSHYEGRFLRGNHLMLPVCIKAGALGVGPERDLFVSPGHGIFMQGVLVPAWRLVNGVSVTQAQSVARVSYYHVEFDAHEVIFAEGVPVESFFGEAFRGQFHNAAEFAALYPGQTAAAVPCAVREEHGFLLRDIQAGVNLRAGIAPAAEVAGFLRGAVEVAGPGTVKSPSFVKIRSFLSSDPLFHGGVVSCKGNGCIQAFIDMLRTCGYCLLPRRL